jgi:hypothetical protein
MAENRITPPLRSGTRQTFLTHVLLGTVTGAVLSGGYGGLVAVVHFACTGRWDRGPAFALGALLFGMAVGMAAGLALALASFRPTTRNPWPLRGRPADGYSHRFQQRAG